MNQAISLYNEFWEDNKKALSFYLKISISVMIFFLGYLLFNEKYKYIYIIIGGMSYLILLSQPKLALYQFIFFMFTNHVILYEPFVLLLDLSGVILISAAVFDILLKGESLMKMPKLTINFIFIISALLITAAFSYNMKLAITPIVRVSMIFVIFLSLVYLLRYIKIISIIKLFFFLAVVHAFIAITPIWAGGDIVRMFGFARFTLDDFLMLSIPMGIIFYLSSQKYLGSIYLIGIFISLLAILATQSRFPITFTFLFSILAIYICYKKTVYESS